MHLIGPPILRRSKASAGKPDNVAGKPPPDFPLDNLLSHVLTATTTPPEKLTFCLDHAWKSDPITTLKLLCHLCGSNRDGFYTAAVWLHQNHPLTLACNIRVFVYFGCLEDWLEILRLLSADPQDGETEEEEEGRGFARARRVVHSYRYDPDFRYLHERVSDLFAESLKSDLEFLNSGDVEKISLACKYCPSIDSSYDRSTLICESIARKIFPRDSNPVYKKIDEAQYVYRVRERLREEVLGPLRVAASRKVIGPLRVAASRKESLSQPKAKGVDKRFRFYVQIAANYPNTRDGLLVGDLYTVPMTPQHSFSSNNQLTSEKQRLAEDLLNREKLENCVAVCDVSESVKGAAATEIRVAMSLLISELSEYPWRGKIFTFDDRPKLKKIEGDSAHSMGELIEQLSGGKKNEKINFQSVFDRILQVWITEKLRKDQMVKRVFVFSNRDFNEAAKNVNKEDFKDVWENYRKRGHKSVPEIVFCNLKDSITCSVVIANQRGKQCVEVMISGFLKSLVNLFLEKEGAETVDVLMKSLPQNENGDVMTLASVGEKYQGLDLVVLD